MTGTVAYGASKKYTDDQIKAIAGGFRFKGKKPTKADLPASGNTPGDTWYVVAELHFYSWIPNEWVVHEEANVWGSITGNIFDQLDLKEKFGYVYDQSTASDTWTIEHNLGYHPSITIVDTANNVVEGEEEYVNENKVIIKFASAFSGKAFLS